MIQSTRNSSTTLRTRVHRARIVAIGTEPFNDSSVSSKWYFHPRAFKGKGSIRKGLVSVSDVVVAAVFGSGRIVQLGPFNVIPYMSNTDSSSALWKSKCLWANWTSILYRFIGKLMVFVILLTRVLLTRWRHGDFARLSMKNEARLTAKAVLYASIAIQLYLTRDTDALR
jgi:hypothetical protein